VSDLPSYPQEAADREAAQRTGQDRRYASGARRLIWMLLILAGALTAALALLMICLGALGGLARNPAGPELMEDGYVVLALGALAIAAAFVTRRHWR
jgi:F0F1-type ATP synthase membrane subunit c/vacuolar-type H+-ATPase subunit K